MAEQFRKRPTFLIEIIRCSIADLPDQQSRRTHTRSSIACFTLPHNIALPDCRHLPEGGIVADMLAFQLRLLAMLGRSSNALPDSYGNRKAGRTPISASTVGGLRIRDVPFYGN